MSTVIILLRSSLLAIVLAWILLPGNGARAHAVLVETAPADGTVLDSAPAEILLRFNESVNPVAFRITAEDGDQRDLGGTTTVADGLVRIRLPGNLSDGTYLLSWRVVSADAHPIGGTLAFAVGAGARPGARTLGAPAEREKWWQLAAMSNRLVGDLALLFAAGGMLFAVVVLHGRVPASLPLARVSAASAAIGAASLVIAIAITGAWLLALPASAVFDAESWRAGLTTNAALRSAVGLAGLALAAAAAFALPARGACAIAAGGALVAAGSFALSGHVASLDPAWPGQLALALHAITVAFWLGSLWPLHVILRTHPAESAACIVRRFSAIAGPAVAMLMVAGAGVALTRLRSVDALVATNYGRILIFKLAVVAIMLVIAIRNRRTLTPTLAAATPGANLLLARNIRVELGFAGIVLLLTAILGHTPPGEPAEAGHDHTAPSGLSVTAESRGHMLHLEITPRHRGANRIAAVVTTASGQPLTASEVAVSLSLPDAGIEPLTRPMRQLRDGTFVLDRVDLPVAGSWHIRIDVLVSDFEKLAFATELDIH